MPGRLVAVGGHQLLQLCPHRPVLLILLCSLLPAAERIRRFFNHTCQKVGTGTVPTYLPYAKYAMEKLFYGILKSMSPARVADPVHYRPDPNPANQNFKTVPIPDPDPALKKKTFFLSCIFFAWFMTKNFF